MSKPAHRGRVIVSSKLPGIDNPGSNVQRSAQPPQNSATRRGSGSKSAETRPGTIVAAGTSALGGLSKEKLQRRVGELEVENQKLKSNLEKAELSVESYRGFLSAKSASRAHSVCVQTDFIMAESQSTSRLTPNKASQSTKLASKLEEAKSKIAILSQELSDSEEHVRAVQSDNDVLRGQYNSLKMNSDLAEVSFRAQVQTLERELRLLRASGHGQRDVAAASSPSARSPTGQASRRVQLQPQQQSANKTSPSHALAAGAGAGASSQQLAPSISSLCKKLELAPCSPPPFSIDRLSARPSAEMLMVSPLSSTKRSKALSASKQPLPSPKSLDASRPLPLRLPARAPPLNALRTNVLSLKSQNSKIANAIGQDLDACKQFFAQCSHKIVSELQKAERRKDVVERMHADTIAGLRHALADAEATRAINYQETGSVVASLEMKLADSKSSYERQLSAARAALDKETDRADGLEAMLDSKMNDKDADISNLTTLFSSVSRELKNLQEKCRAEAAAVKHMGHCKDLVRVATIRELNLDKDRAFSELKFARDIQNVLAFCLETAEKALNETQPQLVERLHDSRRKRTGLLERDVTVRRKDLDQRSAETCAVSSTHLGAFQEKSELKHRKAAEETEALFVAIQNILNIKSSI